MTASLPPMTAKVDAALVALDHKIDWLYYLSPLDNDAMWHGFVDSGYKRVAPLRYPKLAEGYAGIAAQLDQLPIDAVEDPLVQILCQEKQNELKLQFELVMMRERKGFTAVSTELFGGLDPTLSHIAKKIMVDVAPEENEDAAEGSATCSDVLAAAERELDYYRQRAPDLTSAAIAVDDLNSMMMVHHGHFKVASSVCLPKARVAPLIAHEIGVHVVTFYNGGHQPLKLFEVGLAHYDALQEGLGTLAEYLAGFLPARRLRVLAARVLASDLALKHLSIGEIFAQLHEEFGVPIEDAFDVSVRACRGGGLTKDSVYLRGLRDLLAYLASGEDVGFLHLGKFAMEQRQIVKELMEQGWVQPPVLLPRHLQAQTGLDRLKRVREMPLESLFQKEPQL